jgi:polysaccharide export outer membrane protein
MLLTLIILLFTLLCGAGCSSAPYVWVHELPREGLSAPRRTVIGPGDDLEIQVMGDENASARGRVLPDGTLTLPLLGPVRVVGMRPEALASSLERQLQRWVKVPEVTVIIHESVVSVAVIGEVRQPGVIPLAPPATVLRALAAAGGMTEFADLSGIFVLREQEQRPQRIRFSYDALAEGAAAATHFRLEPGDVLIVE